MNRNVVVYNGAEIIQEYQNDVTWEDVRRERDEQLKKADLWMLSDRYSTLTSEQQTSLTDYRQELRDLPSLYYDADDYDMNTGLGSKGANDAADNFPVAPAYMN